MSKLDELVKNWLSQGKAREWTEVVELIEKLQEQARLDEREALIKIIKSEMRNAENGFLGTDNEDEAYNQALSDLLNELNKN